MFAFTFAQISLAKECLQRKKVNVMKIFSVFWIHLILEFQ